MRLLRRWWLQLRAAWIEAQIADAEELLFDHRLRLLAYRHELAEIKRAQILNNPPILRPVK